MSLGTLYTHIKNDDGPYTRTVLPTHLVNYFKIDSIDVPNGPDEHYPGEYPLTKVPAFRFKNGLQLMESIPIALLIIDQVPNKGGLLGNNTPADLAQILQWMNIFNIEFMTPLTEPFKMVAGIHTFDQKVWDVSTRQVLSQVDLFEKHLTKNTYLVGESVTLADLYGASTFMRPIVALWDAKFRAQHPAMMRWFETVKVHPVFGDFFKKIEYLQEFKMPEGASQKN